MLGLFMTDFLCGHDRMYMWTKFFYCSDTISNPTELDLFASESLSWGDHDRSL